jgi:hypothetical protein
LWLKLEPTSHTHLLYVPLKVLGDLMLRQEVQGGITAAKLEVACSTAQHNADSKAQHRQLRTMTTAPHDYMAISEWCVTVS